MNNRVKIEQVTDKLRAVPTCPNCFRKINTPGDGCVLHAFIDCIRARGGQTEEQLAVLHANCDPDALWSDVGEIIDRLQDGGYNSA